MTITTTFLYKVWQPDTDEPFMTLHSGLAIQFFVETVLAGNALFTGKPFKMLAYNMTHDLLERQVAEGSYQIMRWNGPNGEPPLQVSYESGLRTETGGLGVISAALIDAIATVIKEKEVPEQVL